MEQPAPGSVVLEVERRQVEVSWRKIATKLVEAAARQALVGFVPINLGNALTAVFGAADAIDLKETPGTLAWRLIEGALQRATLELLGTASVGRPPPVGDLAHLRDRIALALGDREIAIDRDFLHRPLSLPVYAPIKESFADLLIRLDFAEPDARMIAQRLDSYFPLALYQEERAHWERYASLFEALRGGPLVDAARHAWEWDQNHRALVRAMDEPLFEESFGLGPVYVPLRAWYAAAAPEQPARTRRRAEQMEAPERIVVDLAEDVLAWLASPQGSSDTVRLVTGGPGSGKSSFAKWLAARLARGALGEEAWTHPGAPPTRVLFVPLQRILKNRRLQELLTDYLTIDRFSADPLNAKGGSFSRTLLILDGLDELSKAGDIASAQTAEFVTELRNTLDHVWNHDGTIRVLALVTGRPAAVQAHGRGLKSDARHELHVLPYWVPAKSRYVDPAERLEADQRTDWWARYAATKGLRTELPAALEIEELEELTSEPLTSFLVVKSGFHDDEAGPPLNRNEVYARLVGQVLDRVHGDGPLAVVEEIGDDDRFLQVMEVIATVACYGDGRTASVGTIQRCCPADLKPVLDRYLGQEHGLARLVTAFHFKLRDPTMPTDPGIEFTHKSFAEYLTARRMVGEVESIHDEFSRGKGYSASNGLADWLKLTGPMSMTLDLLRFLRDEVALQNVETVKAWLATLVTLFETNLVEGMPAHLEAETFREAQLRAGCGEEALLAALNACARRIDEVIEIQGLDEEPPSAFIGRLDVVGQECLSHLNLRDADLWFAELSEVNLERADLSNAALDRSNLEQASLQGSNLRARPRSSH